MVVYWKGHTKPGTVSDELVSQLDCYASLASLIGAEVPDSLDSRNYMDAFLGKGHGRESLIVEAKSRLAIRRGDYIMIPPYYGPAYRKTKKVDLGNLPDYELFNVREDRGQRNNVAAENPEILEQMKKEFHDFVGSYYDIDITEKLKNF